MKPHKHAALIHAWADGAKIQFLQKEIGPDEAYSKYWKDDPSPDWRETTIYRIKPTPKPDVVLYGAIVPTTDIYGETVFVLSRFGVCNDNLNNNLKLTFDGETGKLKSAEVL